MNDQGKHADPSSPSTSQPNAEPSQAHNASGKDSLDTEGLKQQGRDAAHDVGEATQQHAENMYNHQRDSAAEQTRKLTDVFQKMADEFDNQEQPYFSEQARKLANTADRFSNKLREKDLRSICSDAQNYSRREPALFIGGAIAAGFLVSRFLRSSSQHQSTSSAQSSGPPSTSYGSSNSDAASDAPHSMSSPPVGERDVSSSSPHRPNTLNEPGAHKSDF